MGLFLEASIGFIKRRKNRQCATNNAQTMNVCDDDMKYTSSEEDSDTNADKDFVPGSNKESTQVMRETLNHLLNKPSTRWLNGDNFDTKLTIPANSNV